MIATAIVLFYNDCGRKHKGVFMKELSFGKYISSIYRNQCIIINDICKDLNISSGQYLFLIKVAENPNITQKELSDMLHFDRANTNRAIKKLESLSYLVVTPDSKDQRNKRSVLTKEGYKVAKLLGKRLNRVTEVLTRGFTDEEKLLFSKLINTMDMNVQNEVQQLKGGLDG